MGNPAPGQFRNGLDCLPGARRIEQRKTVKATESDEVKSFRFLEPFQTVRHGPIMARYDPVIAMRLR
jgi:ATP-dependent RNA circularization protein (DNA/RNA ligase family)